MLDLAVDRDPLRTRRLARRIRQPNDLDLGPLLGLAEQISRAQAEDGHLIAGRKRQDLVEISDREVELLLVVVGITAHRISELVGRLESHRAGSVGDRGIVILVLVVAVGAIGPSERHGRIERQRLIKIGDRSVELFQCAIRGAAIGEQRCPYGRRRDVCRQVQRLGQVDDGLVVVLLPDVGDGPVGIWRLIAGCGGNRRSKLLDGFGELAEVEGGASRVVVCSHGCIGRHER